MAIRKVQEAELIEFEEEIHLHRFLYDLAATKKKNSFFFICTVNGDGSGWVQKSFHKSEVDKALDYIKTVQNKRIFASTVLFESRERVEEKIGQIQRIVIDLDIYKSTKYKNMNIEKVIEDIKNRYFYTEKIPAANVLTYSGGGLYLDWKFEFTPGGNTLKKRRVVAKILFELLKDYEPDKKSLDAVHVFGIPGSINWKYGKDVVVRSFQNELPPYTLADLARRLPSLWDLWKTEKKVQITEEKKPSKKTMGKILPVHKERTLAHDHIVTIRQLIQIRQGEMDGYREFALFFVRNAYHKMYENRFKEEDSTLYLESLKEAYEVNEMFTNPLSDEEIRNNTLNTKKLYRFKTETIIDKFDIDLEEQIQLKVKTKEAKNEKSKRQMKELRKSRGSVVREEYEQERKNEKQHLLDMLKRLLEKNPKAKQKDLAELLGVNQPYISRLKKML